MLGLITPSTPSPNWNSPACSHFSRTSSCWYRLVLIREPVNVLSAGRYIIVRYPNFVQCAFAWVNGQWRQKKCYTFFQLSTINKKLWKFMPTYLRSLYCDAHGVWSPQPLPPPSLPPIFSLADVVSLQMQDSQRSEWLLVFTKTLLGGHLP